MKKKMKKEEGKRKQKEKTRQRQELEDKKTKQRRTITMSVFRSAPKDRNENPHFIKNLKNLRRLIFKYPGFSFDQKTRPRNPYFRSVSRRCQKGGSTTHPWTAIKGVQLSTCRHMYVYIYTHTLTQHKEGKTDKVTTTKKQRKPQQDRNGPNRTKQAHTHTQTTKNTWGEYLFTMGFGATWTSEKYKHLERLMAEGLSGYAISKRTGWAFSLAWSKSKRLAWLLTRSCAACTSATSCSGWIMRPTALRSWRRWGDDV